MKLEGPLVATGITKRFGGLVAVDDLSITIEPGHVVALIGPNGAGKTTFFNCLTGVYEPDAGRITLAGVDISSWDTHRRARVGVGRTFQRLEVFTRMTVYENLYVAAEAATAKGVLRSLLSLRERDAAEMRAVVDEVVDRLGLGWCAARPAGDLPTGVLRIVELGRALCTRPVILLLDEPASGLDTDESEHLQSVLRSVCDDGLGILLVEHDVSFVLGLAERIEVLDFGRLIASGTPTEIVDDVAVQAAYLGAAVRG